MKGNYRDLPNGGWGKSTKRPFLDRLLSFSPWVWK